MGGSPDQTVARIKNMVYMNHTNEVGSDAREEHLGKKTLGQIQSCCLLFGFAKAQKQRKCGQLINRKAFFYQCACACIYVCICASMEEGKALKVSHFVNLAPAKDQQLL